MICCCESTFEKRWTKNADGLSVLQACNQLLGHFAPLESVDLRLGESSASDSCHLSPVSASAPAALPSSAKVSLEVASLRAKWYFKVHEFYKS
jgi:hypothetical protein